MVALAVCVLQAQRQAQQSVVSLAWSFLVQAAYEDGLRRRLACTLAC